MTISIVGVGQGGNAINGGDVTLTFNVAPIKGDVVYLFGGHGAGTNTIGPSTAGYTALISDTSTVCKFGVWRKVMGSSPDTTVVGQGGGNASDAVAYCSFVLRGVDQNTPEDVTTTTSTSTSVNPDPPSITPITNGAWILALASSVVNDATPGTITNYINTVSSTATDTNPFTTAGATRQVANGAENPGAFSSWSSGVWFAASVAVRPALLGGFTPDFDTMAASRWFNQEMMVPNRR